MRFSKERKGVVANHDEDEEAAGGGDCTPAMNAVLQTEFFASSAAIKTLPVVRCDSTRVRTRAPA